MASSPHNTVLVLTQQLDAHADLVIAELNRRGVPVVRFYTADFPQRAVLVASTAQGMWQGTLVSGERTLALQQIASIFYRRPTPFELDPTFSALSRQFASSEARMALGGLLRSLDCLRVNHPEKIVSADYKPWQLQVASEFFEHCRGQMVYKTLSGGERRSTQYLHQSGNA